MISFAASELALIDGLEQQLQANVSLSLLAELERELGRLRNELSEAEWNTFCEGFPKRTLFDNLNLARSGRRRTSNEPAMPPSDVLELVAADQFDARPFAKPSASQIVAAWEYSLPCSRSARARRGYFAREIAEVIRTVVTPRILILGGRLRELEDAWQRGCLSQVQFVAVLPEPLEMSVPLPLHRDQLRIETGNWSHFTRWRGRLGEFDLIYSPGWLDCCDDRQTGLWLGAGAAMLRSGGRMVAANFAPESRDAGWMEACWGWRPFYRSEQALAELALTLRAARVRGHTVHRDESGASAFLEIYSA